jgi:hypothetical protein
LKRDKKGIKPENESALPFLRGARGDQKAPTIQIHFKITNL